MSSVLWIAPSSPGGTSSGEITSSRISASVSVVSCEYCPVEIIQRIRYWINVFGTEVLTL
ncbi:Uncharacterised protein [Mycobacteroides abscessus subsp. abscessus]|nr:Uncharacterised protein [Mycobacteroides abscessus subsp. abscessus]